MNNFKGLKVWQRAIDLSVTIYKLTKTFPKDEIYGLTGQMRRCAVSIASNIAEGSKRNTVGEFGQFIGIAKGSLAELETQAIIANKVGILSDENITQLNEEFDAISRMTFKLLEHNKLNKKQQSSN